MKVPSTLRSLVMMLTLIFSLTAVNAAVPALSTPPPATAETSSYTTMTKKEKKAAKKELKQKLKDLRANLKAGNLSETDTVILVILAILLPPLAVYLYEGSITNKFWLSLILTLLFWVPGVIYSLLVVLGAI